MSGECIPLRRRVLDALAAAGTWVARADLDGFTHCAPALDDTLADLVIDGTAEYRQHAGYRLVGDALARDALRRLHASPQDHRVVLGADEGAKGMRLAFAQRVPAVGLVHWVMHLPPIDDADAALARSLGVMQIFQDSKAPPEASA